jgi:hypothetical protein
MTDRTALAEIFCETLRVKIAVTEGLLNYNEYTSIEIVQSYTNDGWFPYVKIVMDVQSIGNIKATTSFYIAFVKHCIIAKNADIPKTFFEYQDPTSMPIIIGLIIKWMDKHVHRLWSEKHAS